MSNTDIFRLKVGDVVVFGSVPRKVRRIDDSTNRYSGMRHRYVYFAILRRSWTKRPYTLYLDSELRAKHIRRLARGVRLRTTKVERLVQKEIDQSDKADRFIMADEMVGLVT